MKAGSGLPVQGMSVLMGPVGARHRRAEADTLGVLPVHLLKNGGRKTDLTRLS